MMQQAQDFLDESEGLYGAIASLSDAAMERPTTFKGWSINTVIRHLHTWNWAADLSLRDGDGFKAWFADIQSSVTGGKLTDFEQQWLNGLAGGKLLQVWRESYREVAARFGVADPSMRVKWAGPDMSVRSSVTARLMETWAHGQEIYDALGVVRKNADRIRNIVVLGVNTYGWTFMVRGEQPLEPAPYLKLTAPSGELWTYNSPSEIEVIEGLAEEFCQTVTQVRNIADTSLVVSGPNAQNWMSKAQCFAGPAEDPPAAGSRHTVTTEGR